MNFWNWRTVLSAAMIVGILTISSWQLGNGLYDDLVQAQGLPPDAPPTLKLIVITAIHDLTPERQEGRVIYPVRTPAEANHKCLEIANNESALTNELFRNGRGTERGRTSVRCQLLHPDGTLTQLVQPE